MPTGDNSVQVIDLDELNEIMNHDIEFIKECFKDFIKDWPVLYVEVKGAILEKNGSKLDSAAHKLKGTLRYLAAERAADAAFILETAGKGNDFQGIETKLKNMRTECQKVVEYIKNFNR